MSCRPSRSNGKNKPKRPKVQNPPVQSTLFSGMASEIIYWMKIIRSRPVLFAVQALFRHLTRSGGRGLHHSLLHPCRRKLKEYKRTLLEKQRNVLLVTQRPRQSLQHKSSQRLSQRSDRRLRDLQHRIRLLAHGGQYLRQARRQNQQQWHR